MIDKFKKFFKNKKADAAFKRAGPGYRLDESPSRPERPSKNSACASSTSANCQQFSQRSGLTKESQQAAAAALARLDKQKNNCHFNKSLSAIKARIRQEMEAEKQAAQAASGVFHQRTISEKVLEAAPMLAVQGVFFQCPLVGPEILTREEWNRKIRDFLYDQLKEDKGLIACLIIHTLNKSKEKVDACVDTIIKYLENILKNPTEEKYRKIRMNNKVFDERVKPIEGALLILEAAGFEVQDLPHQDSVEKFLVYPSEKLPEAPDLFEILIDGLKNAEPITLDLHRNLQVLLPSQAKERDELPPSFFQLTVEEIKKEQCLRTEAVERNLTLRTKAMRERDEIREIRRYKFALMRIRFPDGIYLQGTFGVHEKTGAVIKFVREALDDENLQFTLSTPDGHHLSEESEASLTDLKLIPAAILTFTAEAAKQTYLKPEILMLVESLTVS